MSAKRRNISSSLRASSRDARRPRLEDLEPRLLLTSYVVDSLGDTVTLDGVVTLREALQAANTNATAGDAAAGAGPDSISFAAALTAGGPATLTLSGGLLHVSDALTLTGPGANLLTLDAAGAAGAFSVDSGVTATIASVAITGATDSAVRNSGTLALTAVDIHDNAGPQGGGVYNSGTLTLDSSTIRANTAAQFGGGLVNWGTLTMVNSTVSGNTTAGFGGGIANLLTFTATNITVASNRADSDGNSSGDGGGIYNATAATLYNTIVAGNVLGTGTTSDDAAGAFSAASAYNLIGNIDGSTGLSGTGSKYGSASGAGVLDAKLAPLANNGGPTPTHLLQPGSPAYDSGDNARATATGLTNDQRGAGYARVLYGTVDIGAVETVRLGTIGDRVWNDADADGVQDTGEVGITGVTVRLYQDGGTAGTFEPGAGDTLAATQVTAAGGAYDFIELAPGNYWVQVDQASAALTGFTLTTAANPMLFSVAAGGDVNGADFGYCTAVFVVTTLTDEADPADMVLSTYNHADLSLREALDLAYDRAGTNNIRFDPGLLAPGLNTVLLSASLGSLAINSSVEIAGPGSDRLELDGYLAQTPIMNVSNGAVLTLSGITLTRGGIATTLYGGGIYVQGGTQLYMDAVTIANCQSRKGAGVYLAIGATAIVTHSLFTGNVVTSTVGGEGGGGIWNSGTLTISDSRLTANSTTGSAAAAAIFGYGDSLTINRCTIDHNTSGTFQSYGGAIHFGQGNALVSDSVISDHAGTTSGGAIWLAGYANVTMTNTTISRTSSKNGAIVCGGASSLVLLGCTISENVAVYRSAGGLSVDTTGAVKLFNCTVSGNINTAMQAGTGGISCSEGVLTITNSTITGNQADYGGVSQSYSGTVALYNTIVAGNLASNGTAGLDVSGAFDSASAYNLIGVIDGSTGLDTDPHTLRGTAASRLDPKMGPLANNLGTTQTHALLLGSPAIEAGDDALALDASGLPLATDQRGTGFPRKMGTAVDIGAFELMGDGSVGDRVWDDQNANGLQDAGEPGLDGVTVRLYSDDGDGVFEPGTGDSLLDSRTTQGGGAYGFQTMAAGQYWVYADPASTALSSYLQSTAADPVAVTMGSGVHITDTDFGYYKPLVVSTAADEYDGDYSAGDLSLREALSLAEATAGYNIIYIPPSYSGQTFHLDQGRGQLAISSSLDLINQGAAPVTIDAGGLSRVFYVGVGQTVSLQGLMLTGGAATTGAGLYLDAWAAVSGWNLWLRNNTASQSGGGAYLAAGAGLTLRDATISGNSAAIDGGAVYSTGTLAMANVTVSTNTAGRHGGGIYAASGSLSAVNVTVANNRADSDANGIGDGGGVYNAVASVTLTNTIVAGNYLGNGSTTADDVAGTFSGAGTNNLIGNADGSTGLAGATGTLSGTGATPLDARLSALGDHGGPAHTQALMVGSLAIGAGSNGAAAAAGLTTDQRGTGYPRVVGAAVDIGAFEGEIGSSSIAGVVFSDADADGTKDVGETGISGVTVRLYRDGGDGVWGGDDTLAATAVTAADGSYTFGELYSGQYFVQADTASAPLAGYTLVGGSTGNNLSIAPATDEARAAVNFAFCDHLFMVTTLTDEADPADMVLATFNPADLSLREALDLAYDRAGTDYIRFEPSLAASPGGGTILLNGTELAVNSSVTILGPGSGLLAIDAQATSRAIHITGTNTVHLVGFTVRNGHVNPGPGAGLYVDHGSLSMDDLTFSGCKIGGNSACGGGLYLGSSVTTTIANSRFQGNAWISNTYGGGGGLYNAGILTVTDTTFDSNFMADLGSGAGMCNAGTAYVQRCVFNANHLTKNGYGGAIYSSGPLTIQDCSFTNNSAGASTLGGDIAVTGRTAQIENTTFTGSSAAGAGAVYATGVTTGLVMVNCTISNSTASGSGGAMYVDPGVTTTIINCTMSGNQSNNSGTGGALYTKGVITLINTTITANRASDGGGIYVAGGTVRMNNTIVAGNTLNNLTTPDDVYGAFDSAGSHNLIGTGDGSTGLTHGVNGNLVGANAAKIDPLLGPLADNYGPTQTHALLAMSPALDAGLNSLAVDSLGVPLAADQRGAGFPRVVGAAVDIGAFERGGDASIGDRIWHDSDNDAVQDAGEEGIAGVPVKLYSDDGDGVFEPGAGDALIDTRTSLTDGAYDFVGLSPGTYWVKVDETCTALNGFVRTTAANPILVSLSANQAYAAADVGYYPPLIVTTLDDEADARDMNIATVNLADVSLREAIALADGQAGFNVIHFSPSLTGGVIALRSGLGQLSLNTDVEIDGPGSGLMTIDAGGHSRVLSIGQAAEVTVRGVRLTGGSASTGAGLFVGDGATVTASDLAVDANAAAQRGGGIYVSAGASMDLDGSAVSGNAANYHGGGLYADVDTTVTVHGTTFSGNTAISDGGGIYSDGTVALGNVTISGNSARRHGGGLYADLGAATLVNVTVADNRSDSDASGSGLGGGLYVAGAPAVLHNTIVAGNTRGAGTADDVTGELAQAGSHNLIGVDAGLLPLGNYGGATLTHALKPGSVALDAGSDAAAIAAGLTTDQNGLARFIDHDGDLAATVDIGAFEANPSIVVTALNDESTDTDGLRSLREAVAAADAVPGFDTILFDAGLSAGGAATVTLTQGELDLGGWLDLEGPGASLLTISGGGTSRVLHIQSDAAVRAGGLTLTGGSAFDGGAILNEGSLTLTDAEVTAGVAAQDGGGISNTGTLALSGVTLAGNQALRHGGAIANRGTLTLLNSTISGNVAGTHGGGLYTDGAAASVKATNVTIAGNTAAAAEGGGDGGGVYAGTGSTSLANTVVAGNVRGTLSPAADDVAGAFASGSGSDLIGAIDGSTGLQSAAGVQYGTAAHPLNAMLKALDYYDAAGEAVAAGAPGAPAVRTHGILPGSPLLDAGSDALASAGGLSLDQRGMDRTRDGSGAGRDQADIGAFEQQVPLNQAPTMTEVATLQGAVENEAGQPARPFYISYETLQAAGDADDADGDPIGFRIAAVNVGTLTLGGADAAGLTLWPGQELTWTPPAGVSGTVAGAFTLQAFDGLLTSAALPVDVDVTPVGNPEDYAVLFSGGGSSADSNFTRYYENLRTMYQTLVGVYGLKPYNIYVLYADGREAGVDRADGQNSDMSFAVNVESATAGNLRDRLVRLSRTVDANDHFFFWSFDHGVGVAHEPDTVGEEVLNGWGPNELIGDEQLAVWLQGLHAGDSPATFGVPAGYAGVAAGFDTYVFAECFSGGMLDNLTIGANQFAVASTTHYEASYGDAFAAAFTQALAGGYGDTSRAFQYAIDHDAHAGDGAGPGGDWAWGVEHPWSVGADFNIFARADSINASPTMTRVLPLRRPVGAGQFVITFDMLKAASDAVDPNGDAVVFVIDSVGVGTMTQNGSAVVPGLTRVGYGQSVTWQYGGGSEHGVINAFTVKLAGWSGPTAGVTVPVRTGSPVPAPTAVDDLFVLQKNTVGVYADVLANDQASAAGAAAIVGIGVPAHGTVTLAGGAVRYTPGADFTGYDAFSYVIQDGALTDMALATVHVVDYDPNAAASVTYKATVLEPAPGTAGLPAGTADGWNWSLYRQPFANYPWTISRAGGINEDGLVSVVLSRPDNKPATPSVWDAGGTQAGYLWQTSFEPPYWTVNNSTGDIASNTLMLLRETSVNMEQPSTTFKNDGTPRKVIDGVVPHSVQNAQWIAAVEAIDPNAWENLALQKGLILRNFGQASGQLWQEVDQNVYPIDVNAAGTAAVNDYTLPGNPVRAAVWNTSEPYSTATRLAGWGGSQRSSAEAVNAAGHVVGFAEYTSNLYHAFLYDGSAMTNLGVLAAGQQSWAYALNASDQAVGFSGSSMSDTSTAKAFLWDAAGGMRSLGTLSTNNGTDYSIAYDINDAGVIVGESNGHAFVYVNGTMYDLNAMVNYHGTYADYTLTEARGINNKGQIVATGVFDGKTRAVYLEIVPTGPQAADDLTQTSQRQTVVANVLANDAGASLTLSRVDPPTGGARGSWSWGFDGIFRYDPAGQFNTLAVGQTAQEVFTCTVSDVYGHATTSHLTVQVTGVPALDTLYVLGVTPTASGFDAHLSKPLDTGKLNLYDGQDASADLADVTLVGAATGPVRGSLTWDAAANVLHFVKTGGPLAADTYTIVMASRSDGLVTPAGEQLDGDANGAAGTDYTSQFTMDAVTRTMSLPDFARGPGQAVNVPAVGSGLPITLSDASGALGVGFTLRWNPALLNVTGLSLAAGMTGWSLLVNLSQASAGMAVVSVTRTTALLSGTLELVLQADVPASAPYGAAEVITFEGLQINEGQLPCRSDVAVHKAMFLGDASGDGRYLGLDASLIARVAVGLDTGFDACDMIDPLILADVTGNGAVSPLDVSYVAQKTVFLPRPEIPDLPGFIPTITPGGPDPVLAIPSGRVVGQNGAIVLPVTVTEGAAGIQSALLVIDYNTAFFDLAGGDVVRGGLISALVGNAAWDLTVNPDDAAGRLVVLVSSPTALIGGTGDLLAVTWHVPAGAPSGQTALDLRTDQSALNDGYLALTGVDGGLIVAHMGDANCDGKVDLQDFSLLKANYNQTGTGVAWGQGNFNGDTKVDLQDFSLLKAHYNHRAGDANVLPVPVAPAAGPSSAALGLPTPTVPLGDASAQDEEDPLFDPAILVRLSDALAGSTNLWAD